MKKQIENRFGRAPLLLLLLIMLIWIACARLGNDGEDTLIIGITGDTDSFHPLLTRSRFGSEIAQLRFLNLMKEQPDFMTFKPELARSWNVEDGGKRIRVHLRTDVFWSDSVKVTARDVEFTYRKQTDDAIGWASSSIKDHIQAVTVIDDSTVDFIFDRPYMYQLMDINDGVILPAHALEGLSNEEFKKAFDRNIPENGPYRLQTWVPNQYMEFVGNELYFDKNTPKIKRVIFKIVPDKTQLINQLKTGEIQVVDGLLPHEAAKLARLNQHLRVEHFPYIQCVEIAWNLRKKLFSDVRVRKAMTLAIDREALVDHLLSGYGKVCTGPIHPLLWAYNPNLKPLPFDPEQAKALLKTAGWRDTDADGYLEKNGRKLEFGLLSNVESQLKKDAQIMIQEMLKKVGIKVKIRRLEWSVYVEKLMGRDYDAVLVGLMSATKVDPMPAWHSSMIGVDGFNLSCYRNKRVDWIIEQARESASKERALPLWYEFQEIIVRDIPATFLWIPDRIVGLDSRIQGCTFSPVSTFYNLPQWYYQQNESSRGTE